MPVPLQANYSPEEEFYPGERTTNLRQGFDEPAFITQDSTDFYHEYAPVQNPANAVSIDEFFLKPQNLLMVAGVRNALVHGFVYVQRQIHVSEMTKQLRQRMLRAGEVADSYEEKFVYKYTGFGDEIRLMSGLQPDWNTYGSDPPNTQAIDNAQKILDQLFRHNFLPSRVVASAEGGVALVFLSQERQADIEVFNDGEVLAGIYHLDRDTEIIDLRDSAIKEIAQKIHDFLY